MFPQRPRITVPSPFGGHYSAQFKGKLLYMQHTHDTSLWPDQAILYAENVARYGTPENFRLQRSEEHTSELQSLMRISYAVFCLKKKNKNKIIKSKRRSTYKKKR